MAINVVITWDNEDIGETKETFDRLIPSITNKNAITSKTLEENINLKKSKVTFGNPPWRRIRITINGIVNNIERKRILTEERFDVSLLTITAYAAVYRAKKRE